MKTFEELRDEFLAEQKEELKHYGVAGMKWGKRKASTSGGSDTPSKRDLKSLDKATKARQNTERNAVIEKARADYSANARKNYLDAKSQYKADKHVIGKRAAKEAFDKVKLQNIADAEIAQQAKSGKETVQGLLIAGAFVVGAVALTALSRS